MACMHIAYVWFSDVYMYILLMNMVDENQWWILLMGFFFEEENCWWLMTCFIVYEYMQCQVICSCIDGQVLLLMAIVDGKLAMLIVDNGSIGKINPRSKWYHMHEESCLENYMHMNYVKCLIIDYATLVIYVNWCDVVNLI